MLQRHEHRLHIAGTAECEPCEHDDVCLKGFHEVFTGPAQRVFLLKLFGDIWSTEVHPKTFVTFFGPLQPN